MTDTKTDALIVFTPSGKRARFAIGTPVLQAARSLGVDIDSVCGGRAICGRCQVTVGEGEFAKHGITSSSAAPLRRSPRSSSATTKSAGLQPGRRLSCQTRLLGDVVIDVPPDSQVHKQVVRKRAEARAIDMNPVTRLHYHRSGGAGHAQALLRPRTRLSGARGAVGASTNITCDLAIIRRAAEDAAPGEWKITCRRELARCRAAAASSSPSGPASMTAPSAWRSMSARPPSRRI